MLTQCTRCNATVDAEIHCSHDTRDEETGIPERYSFGSCPSCNAPLLLFQNDWGDGRWDVPSRVYPPRNDILGWNIPKPIANAFAESVRCFSSKAYTASAIMCRKTLEGVCENHQAKGPNLQKRLDALKELGFIDGRLYEWANELRIVGNEAAHDVYVEVSADDARDTQEFTRALLEYAYTFRHRFDEFKKRRAGAATKKTKLVSAIVGE